MDLDKFNEQSDMTRDGVSLPVKLWYSFLGILIKARDSRRRRNMPEFGIELKLVKTLCVKASDYTEAIEKVTEDFNDGIYNLEGFEVTIVKHDSVLTKALQLDEKIGKAFPIITQEDLDTCDGGLNDTQD